MKDWLWRLTAFLLTGVIFLPVLLNHPVVSTPQRPTFLLYTAGHVLVRVIDIGRAEAIYRFSDGTTVRDVKNMTHDHSVLDSINEGVFSKRLKNGDVVEFAGDGDKVAEISLKAMGAAERIALGIPLDPNLMSFDDWMYLPGVGRSTAEAIMADRQKNGDFCSFESVSRVSGIGAGRIKTLGRFFSQR